MKNFIIIVGGAGLIVVLVIISRLVKASTLGPGPLSVTSKPSPPVSPYPTRTDDQKGVTVQITPIDLGRTAWRFNVIMDTHSMELDADLTQTSSLIVNGQEFQPVSWDGNPPGGHHRQGTLTFPAPSLKPSELKLKLRHIADVPERSFTWTIQ